MKKEAQPEDPIAVDIPSEIWDEPDTNPPLRIEHVNNGTNLAGTLIKPASPPPDIVTTHTSGGYL